MATIIKEHLDSEKILANKNTILSKWNQDKPCYLGVVESIDNPGTTVFIQSGERLLLAFQNPKNRLVVGNLVTFKIDGLRAVEVEKQSDTEPETPQPVTQAQTITQETNSSPSDDDAGSTADSGVIQSQEEAE